MLSPLLLAEYHALTQTAGFVPLAPRSRIELTGEDRAKFLHNFCTNDIKRLQPGQGCEAFVCNVKGATLGHVYVFCEMERLLIDSVPDQATVILNHLDRYLIREKVVLRNATGDIDTLLLAGPEAMQKLAGLFSIEIPPTIGSHISLNLGSGAVLRRVEIAGVYSFLLDAAPLDHSFVETTLLNHGFVACSENAMHLVRIEHGFPWFGIDFTVENLPQELARDSQAVSFTKGCYLGQETVARIDALGHVNRTFGAVVWENAEPPKVGTPILVGEKEVGQVTSTCFSPRTGHPLTLAFVRRGFNSPDTIVQSSLGPGRVISLPLGG